MRVIRVGLIPILVALLASVVVAAAGPPTPAAASPGAVQVTAEELSTQGRLKEDNGDVPGALADYTEAIRVEPGYAPAYYRRAELRLRQADGQGALADFTEAIRHDPGYVSAYVGRGVARGRQGDRQGAVADYDTALRIDPASMAANYNRGVTRYELGDLQGALDDLTTTIGLDPDLAFPYEARAQVYVTLGDHLGASMDWQTAVQLLRQYRDPAGAQRVLATARAVLSSVPALPPAAAALLAAAELSPLTLTTDDLPPGYREVVAESAEVDGQPAEIRFLLRSSPGTGPRSIMSFAGREAPDPPQVRLARVRQEAVERFGHGPVANQGTELSDVRELDASVLGEPALLYSLRYRQLGDAEQADAAAEIEGDGALAYLYRGDVTLSLMVLSTDGRAVDDLVGYARLLNARLASQGVPAGR